MIITMMALHYYYDDYYDIHYDSWYDNRPRLTTGWHLRRAQITCQLKLPTIAVANPCGLLLDIPHDVLLGLPDNVPLGLANNVCLPAKLCA